MGFSHNVVLSKSFGGQGLTLCDQRYGGFFFVIVIFTVRTGWPLAKNPDPVPEPGPGCRIFPVISNFPVQFFSRPDFFPPGQIFFPVVGVNLRSIWRFSCDSDGPVELVRFFNVDWYQNHPKTWSGSRFLITEALFSM